MQGESAGVPEIPLDRQVLGVSLAAMYLHGLVGHVDSHLGSEELGLERQDWQRCWPSPGPVPPRAADSGLLLSARSSR